MLMRTLSLLLRPLRVVVVALTCAGALLASANAPAQTVSAQSKIAPDLMAIVSSSRGPVGQAV
jgi:hypothetical protein